MSDERRRIEHEDQARVTGESTTSGPGAPLIPETGPSPATLPNPDTPPEEPASDPDVKTSPDERSPVRTAAAPAWVWIAVGLIIGIILYLLLR